MFSLELFEIDGLKTQTAKRINQFNKSAGQLKRVESEIVGRLHNLNSETVDSLDQSQLRAGEEIFDDWHSSRCELLDCLRKRQRLLSERLDLLAEMGSFLRKEIESNRGGLADAVSQAKAQLTAAESGIDSIPANGGGRLIDINQPAAEIQFEHRAQQNALVVPLRERQQNLESFASTVQTHQAATNQESETTEKRIRDLWQAISGGLRGINN